MSSAPIISRRMAEEMLVQKAAQDDAFRRRLLTNPKATIFEMFGFRVPSDVRITVLEETSDELYLVLPASCATAELAERELAMVAGGAEEGCGVLEEVGGRDCRRRLEKFGLR